MRKKPKMLYRYCLYDFEVKKCRVFSGDMVEVVGDVALTMWPMSKSVLYRVRDAGRSLDFHGFDNREAAKREGVESLRSEIWKHEAALKKLKSKIEGGP